MKLNADLRTIKCAVTGWCRDWYLLVLLTKPDTTFKWGHDIRG